MNSKSKHSINNKTPSKTEEVLEIKKPFSIMRKATLKNKNERDYLAGVPFSCISRVTPVKPSACGRVRNLPPQVISFPFILIIPFSKTTVKHTLILYQSLPFFFIYLHKCNDRIFEIWIIHRSC